MDKLVHKRPRSKRRKTDYMSRNLARELQLRFGYLVGVGNDRGIDYLADDVDFTRVCEHTPDQTYTREPCSCGRSLWPPRGRGRGESLTSPRRLDAKLKGLDVWELHRRGWTYKQIARQLGYADASGAWRAEQRLRDQQTAWLNYEERTGHRPYNRHQPTPQELASMSEYLQQKIAGTDPDTVMDNERIAAAVERVQRLLFAVARDGSKQ